MTDRERFERATKIDSDAYDGHVSDGEEMYWASVGDCIEHFTERGHDLPEYVWATHGERLSLKAADILDSEYDGGDYHEDARMEISTEAEMELQALLDAWCAEHGTVTYFADHARAVVFSEATRAKVASEIAGDGVAEEEPGR